MRATIHLVTVGALFFVVLARVLISWVNPRFEPWRRNFASAFAAVITLGNISFPLMILALSATRQAPVAVRLRGSISSSPTRRGPSEVAAAPRRSTARTRASSCAEAI